MPDKQTTQEPDTNTDVKQFWLSKVLWTNFVMFLAIIIQKRWGFVIEAEMQALAIAIINIILRHLTKKPIIWS